MATNRSNSRTSTPLGAADPREDPRTVKSSGSETRGSRASEDADRVNDEGTALTVAQRQRMLRDEFTQEALPRVPEIPGWHLCWLSTTNSYDPIHKRMRLGYVPVKVGELPGFESLKMNSGEFAGCISCNEMLLFKIPAERYLEIMDLFHHTMPAEEEEALRAQLVDPALVDSKGKKLGQITEDSDGFDSLGSQRPRQGVFAL